MQKRLIKTVVAVVLLTLLFLAVDLRELWTALRHLTLTNIAYLLLISVGLVYVSALKWSYFLAAFGNGVSVLRLFNLYMLGYFVNLILPSFVGGDAARSYYLGKKVGHHEALAATILERYTGLVAMVILSFGFMWFVDLVTLQIKIAVICVSLGLVGLTVLSLEARLLNWLGEFKHMALMAKHARKIQAAFHLAKTNRPLLFKALGLSLLYHALAVINTAAAAHAVGWFYPPARELFVVLPLIMLIGAIPIAPNGLGLQEGAFVYFLHGLGASPEQALGLGLVLRAKVYLCALFGYFVWLRERGINRASPAEG